jgi:hypothetical protein
MRYILSLLMMIVVFGLQAQTYTFTTSQDTIIDTGSSTHVLAVNKAYRGAVIEAKVTEVSGATDGTAVLQVSTSGVAASYKTISTVEPDYATIDSFDLADQTAAQYFYWNVSEAAYPYYQVKFTGTGTMRAVTVVKMYLKKP